MWGGPWPRVPAGAGTEADAGSGPKELTARRRRAPGGQGGRLPDPGPRGAGRSAEPACPRPPACGACGPAQGECTHGTRTDRRRTPQASQHPQGGRGLPAPTGKEGPPSTHREGEVPLGPETKKMLIFFLSRFKLPELVRRSKGQNPNEKPRLGHRTKPWKGQARPGTPLPTAPLRPQGLEGSDPRI